MLTPEDCRAKAADLAQQATVATDEMQALGLNAASEEWAMLGLVAEGMERWEARHAGQIAPGSPKKA